MTRFDRPGSAGRTALVGVLSAGGLAVLWLACLTPSGRTVLLAGRAAGWLCWAVIALLGLLLLPNKAVSLMFALFLGLYPVAKSRLEQLRQRGLEWALKLLLFNGAFLLLWYGLRGLLGLSLPAWLAGRTWLILPAANLVFVCYDIGLSKLIALMTARLCRRGQR